MTDRENSTRDNSAGQAKAQRKHLPAIEDIQYKDDLARVSVENVLHANGVNWETSHALPADIIENVIADAEVTLLGGHGGIGKGFMALQMAIHAACGKPLFGDDRFKVRESMRVFYYSAEDGGARLSRRINLYLQTLTSEEQKLVRKNLLVYDASDAQPLYAQETTYDDNGKAHRVGLAATSQYNIVKGLLEAFDPGLIVVDGASDTFDGNEIVKREVTAFMKLLKRFYGQKGVLLVVHIDRAASRGHASGDEGYSGNVAWHNVSRRRLYLKQHIKKSTRDGEEEARITKVTFNVMKNQDAKPIDPFEIARDPDTGFWRSALQILGGGNFAHVAQDLEVTRAMDAGLLLALIAARYKHEQWISTAPAANSQTNAYALLHRDEAFPDRLRRMNKKAEAKAEVNHLLLSLERTGQLERERYTGNDRHGYERWKPREM